jgi:sugar phosphate isomerase/epimerase
MEVKLGINTGFALNRYTAPEQWIPLVAERFGLRLVQFTADLLNPSLPDDIIVAQLQKMQSLLAEYGVQVAHTFTSAFTRVNHLSHPDPAIRAYWVEWFGRFADISAALGAESMGSHFGILTVPDLADPAARAERFQKNIDGWHQIATLAAQKGLRYLTREPMSLPREYGETLAETRRIHTAVNHHSPLPFKLCLDVDHGDVSSPNSDDTDPYAWIREFATEAPIIHLKQTSANKHGHWPFAPEYNENGRITPEKLLTALADAGVQQVTLLLELSFRERQPYEDRMIDDIVASVEYWRPFVTI